MPEMDDDQFVFLDLLNSKIGNFEQFLIIFRVKNAKKKKIKNDSNQKIHSYV